MNKPDSQTLTVLAEKTSHIEVVWKEGKPYIDKKLIQEILGWELKDEGLCFEDICVPLEKSEMFDDSSDVDLNSLLDALDFLSVLDSEAGFIAIETFSSLRHSALTDRIAPDIKLPDINGIPHRLSEWKSKKKLLVAFASW